MVKTKQLRREGHTYKWVKWVTRSKKELIQRTHSQANSHFIFKRAHAGFNLYVRI